MDLSREFAHLQSKVDFLETELSYLNTLLVKCGFFEGIQTLKETAIELLKETGSSLM